MISARMKAQGTGGSGRRMHRLPQDWSYLAYYLCRVKHNRARQARRKDYGKVAQDTRPPTEGRPGSFSKAAFTSQPARRPQSGDSSSGWAWGVIVADLGRAHLQPVRPQPLNAPRPSLRRVYRICFNQFDALLFIHLSRLLLEQLVDHWIAEATPVDGRTRDKFVQHLIGFAHRQPTRRGPSTPRNPWPPGSSVQLALSFTLCSASIPIFFHADMHVYTPMINIRQFDLTVQQHRLEAVRIAGLGQQAFGFLEVSLVVFAETWKLLATLPRSRPHWLSGYIVPHRRPGR